MDHYLGKETVQNLLVLRLPICCLSRFGQTAVDHIDNVAESVGLKAATPIMTAPVRCVTLCRTICCNWHSLRGAAQLLDADNVRDEKIKVLRAERFDSKNVTQNTVRAQYTGGTVNGEPCRAMLTPCPMP